jgi:hypothetical protein
MKPPKRTFKYVYYWSILLSIVAFSHCRSKLIIPETADIIYVYAVPYQDSDEEILVIENRKQINEIIKIINSAKKEPWDFLGHYGLQIRSDKVSYFVFVQDNLIRIDGRTYSTESDLELMIRNLIEKSK